MITEKQKKKLKKTIKKIWKEKRLIKDLQIDLACILRLEEGWSEEDIRLGIEIEFTESIFLDDLYHCSGKYKPLK